MQLTELATSMRLTGGPVEMIKPLNVGLMFFNERPDHYFSCARIEVVDKPNPTGEGNHKLVSQRYRNRRIGDFLKELRFVEGRNTGIPTMIKALKDNSSPMLLFEADEERTYFTVIFPVNREFIVEQTDNKQVSSPKKRRSKQQIQEMVLSILQENETKIEVSNGAKEVKFSLRCLTFFLLPEARPIFTLYFIMSWWRLGSNTKCSSKLIWFYHINIL